MDVFRRLLIAVRSQSPMKVAEIFDLARHDKYTGEIRFHLSGGRPKKVELNSPLQTQIIEEEDGSSWATAPKGLDKPG